LGQLHDRDSPNKWDSVFVEGPKPRLLEPKKGYLSDFEGETKKEEIAMPVATSRKTVIT
jgi:hypothetical protein